jgi:WD40 repeat protein
MMKFEPKQIAEFKSERQISAARFSHDGSILAAVGYEPTVRRWQFDGKVLTPMPVIEGFHGYSTALAFHPKLPRLFAADSWGQLRCIEGEKTLWQHESAHDGWLRQIAISPDGTHIATCGKDGFVRVWDATTGKKLAEHQAGEDVYALTITDRITFGDMRGRIETRDLDLKKKQRGFDAAVLYKLDRIQDAMSAFTGFAGLTPMSLASRPWNLKLKRSAWKPRSWKPTVAWKSLMWSGSLTML